jgi:RNA-directed DNA polymerase
VVDADLQSCCDTIPHDRLRALVKERVADGRVLALGESFLRAGVVEEAPGGQPTEGGTPPGGVLSPRRANLYLHPLDQQREQAGWERVRQADDCVILCRPPAEAPAAWEAVRAGVNEAGRTLPPDKTRGVDARAPGGCDCLGYPCERGRRGPRQKSRKRLNDRLREQTPRRSGRSRRALLTDGNRPRRGG